MSHARPMDHTTCLQFLLGTFCVHLFLPPQVSSSPRPHSLPTLHCCVPSGSAHTFPLQGGPWPSATRPGSLEPALRDLPCGKSCLLLQSSPECSGVLVPIFAEHVLEHPAIMFSLSIQRPRQARASPHPLPGTEWVLIQVYLIELVPSELMATVLMC